MSGSHWDLPELMKGLHNKIWQELQTARAAIGHSGAKGDGSEKVWHRFFRTYLPAPYAVDKATIMDSTGAFSGEIDVVLYDRQYTFLIFELEGVKVIPAEAFTLYSRRSRRSTLAILPTRRRRPLESASFTGRAPR
jgi:hypothetical protein